MRPSPGVLHSCVVDLSVDVSTGRTRAHISVRCCYFCEGVRYIRETLARKLNSRDIGERAAF
jgi:hypothetical protein